MADNCPSFNNLLICSGDSAQNFILPMSASSCTFSELRNATASPGVDFSPFNLQVPLDLTIPGITEVRMHLPILHFVFMPPIFGCSICTHSSIQEVGKGVGMRTCHCYAYNSWFYLHCKAFLTKRSYPISPAAIQQTGRASPETLDINHHWTERLCALLLALISHCITISCREVEWTLVQHKCHRSPRLVSPIHMLA